MKNKFLLTATLVAALTLATPLVANAAEAEGGSWKSNATGWWYEYADGNYVTNDFLTDKDGKTYYFKADGYMAKGWQYVQDKYGWFYFDNSGAMVTGWAKIDGDWYWFNTDKESDEFAYGQMANRTCTVDGKKQVFARSGQWVSGWTWASAYTDPVYGTEIPGGWYYANVDGTPYDNDAREYVNGGWLFDGVSWYFIGNDGSMQTGWYDIYDEKTDAFKWYYFKPTGQMVTGWYQNGNTVSNWIYCNADGTAYDGWMVYNGAWYHISEGDMDSNTWIPSEVEDSDVEYYVGADGRMVTGWYNTSRQTATSSSSSWIFCNADGSDYTGWVLSSGKWYYISDGYMRANTRVQDFNQKEPQQSDYKKADGTYDSVAYRNAYAAYKRAENAAPYYIFDGTGAMVTGWYNAKETRGGQTISDVWYYADADGKGHDGWLLYKGAWYYIEDGLMLTNCYTPDGYWVGVDGIWR